MAIRKVLLAARILWTYDWKVRMGVRLQNLGSCTLVAQRADLSKQRCTEPLRIPSDLHKFRLSRNGEQSRSLPICRLAITNPEPGQITSGLPTKRPEFVSLQVEHKQFIGNGHLVDSSLR